MPHKATVMYYLDRVTPDGRELRQGPFGTRAEAASYAGYALHDNGAASKREAQAFTASLIATKTGATVTHGSGYSFTILWCDVYPERNELRDLIRSKLTEDMTPDQATEAVMGLFREIEDRWDEFGISTQLDEPGQQVLERCSLLMRTFPREARQRNLTPNRSVTGE